MRSKIGVLLGVVALLTLQACAVPTQQNYRAAAPTDIRDQWDVRISKAELVFPHAEGHVVANKVKNALSQFAIPANVSFRPQPGPIPDRPEAPQLMPPTSAIPSPDYNCDNGFAVITRRPAPVQNAFAFIAEGHQVCLYNFKNGVKAYVLFYSVKKMESLTAGLFNGITRAIRGTDEERAQNQLMESIEDIRKEIPYLLVERIEIPGAPIQTPDAEAVAALVPPPRMEVAAGNGTGASALTAASGGASSAMQVMLDARKNLTAMGLEYHSQEQFLEAIQRKDAVAVQLFLAGGAIDLNAKNKKGQTPIELARAKGDETVLSLLEDHRSSQGQAGNPVDAASAAPQSRTAVSQGNPAPADLSRIPPEIRQKLEDQLNQANLSPRQKELARAQFLSQYLKLQQIAELSGR